MKGILDPQTFAARRQTSAERSHDFHGRLARAFGRGSDARLAGHPQCENPYHWSDRSEREQFDAGWHHIEHEWAVEAKWPHQRKPEVSEQTDALAETG